VRLLPDNLRGRVITTDRATEMLIMTFSTAVAGWSLREVFKCIEANTVHYREVSPELLHICLKSLSNGEKNKPTGPQLGLVERPKT
jgi:hypothetical protein